jgi:hypothetical protein
MTYILDYNHQRQFKALKFKSPWLMIEEYDTQTLEQFRENIETKIVELNNPTIPDSRGAHNNIAILERTYSKSVRLRYKLDNYYDQMLYCVGL